MAYRWIPGIIRLCGWFTIEIMFKFKQFTIKHGDCQSKIGTDGVLLGAWAEVSGVGSVLDIGTGTGVIAMMLAQRAKSANITAIDIESKCCEIAAENFQNTPWSSRLTIANIPIQELVTQKGHAFDLIVSNPPYYDGIKPTGKGKQLFKHSENLPHLQLLSAANQLLTGKGHLCVVLPVTEANKLIDKAGDYQLFLTHKTTVFSKKKKKPIRLLMQFEKNAKNTVKRTLTLREQGGGWTEEYRQLVVDFYL